MKKPILKLTILCLAASVLGTACKKESSSTPNQSTQGNQHSLSNMKVAPAGLANDVTVSPYGFLILNNGSYVSFINNNNAADILQFQQSIDFQSQLTVSGQADNVIPTAPENGGDMFNRDGIVQIGGIVIRGVNNSGYLLAMPVEDLTAASYQQLASKDFDPQIMAKLRVGSDYFAGSTNDYNFEAFVRANIGHDGTNDPVISSPTPSALRFWGWGRHGDHYHYYVCWIPIARWNIVF